jgi:hypothetical protein
MGFRSKGLALNPVLLMPQSEAYRDSWKMRIYFLKPVPYKISVHDMAPFLLGASGDVFSAAA